MKKLIMILVAGLAGVLFAQTIYTKGTRFDDSTAGVTYIGKAAVNTSFAKTGTVAQLEAANVWMIKKITTNGIYFAGGDENAYSYSWTNRAAATNIIYYK